jgi:hypothetical protein
VHYRSTLGRIYPFYVGLAGGAQKGVQKVVQKGVRTPDFRDFGHIPQNNENLETRDPEKPLFWAIFGPLFGGFWRFWGYGQKSIGNQH